MMQTVDGGERGLVSGLTLDMLEEVLGGTRLQWGGTEKQRESRKERVCRVFRQSSGRSSRVSGKGCELAKKDEFTTGSLLT